MVALTGRSRLTYSRAGDAVNSNLQAKSSSGSNVKKWTEKVPIQNHVDAMECIMGFLGDHVSRSIHKDVMAVGHRIVHGLDIHNAVLLNDQVVEKLRLAAQLAPLHNPPGLQGIAAAQKVFSGVPQARSGIVVVCCSSLSIVSFTNKQQQGARQALPHAMHTPPCISLFQWVNNPTDQQHLMG